MFGLRLLAGETFLLLTSLVGIGALVGFGEVLRRWGVSGATTRRLVHTGVGLFVAATPVLFRQPLPVYALAALFVVLNAAARARRWWPSLHAARPASWGTVALPLSVLPALAATWSVAPERLLVFQLAYLILACADPVAAWVGEGGDPPSGDRPSSLRGSLAFAGTALLLSVLVLGPNDGWTAQRSWIVAGGITLVATVTEAVSHRGWDNLFVVAAVILAGVPLQTGHLSLLHFGGALGVGVVFGGLAYGANALDERGAATGGLFAASLAGLGGWPWIVPGIVFFALSSALTGLRKEAQDESPRRTQQQVLANGGVAWIALAGVAVAPPAGSDVYLYGYAAFVGALAAAAADTWATELGRWSPSPPRSLRTGRPVPPGTSGAVSVVGTGAALLGAASVVGAALIVSGPLTGSIGTEGAVLVGAGGFGMVVDSVMGAFVQAQYPAPASEGRVETPPAPHADPIRGWATIGNNAVNFVATLTGALGALAGIMLVG